MIGGAAWRVGGRRAAAAIALPRERGRLFFLREMDVAVKCSHGNLEAELLFEILRVSVDEVIRPLIALVNERVMHVERLDPRIALAQSSDVRIVLPERVARRPHVGLETSWMREVQIAHR